MELFVPPGEEQHAFPSFCQYNDYQCHCIRRSALSLEAIQSIWRHHFQETNKETPQRAFGKPLLWLEMTKKSKNLLKTLE